MNPLSPEQRDLAARYFPYARSLARPYRDLYPRLADELDSAAAGALVGAAGRFDPARGVPFEAFARRNIRGALQDLIAKSKRDAASNQYLLIILPDSTTNVEKTEEVDRLLGSVSPETRAILRWRFLEGFSIAEVAARSGIDRSTVYDRINEAKAAARAMAEVN